jgi:hypothetical protein
MAAYLSVLALCTTSVVLGAAICCPRGGWAWTAPAVGFSAAMLLALFAIRLPGHVTTAVVVLVIALLASVLSLSGRGVDWRAALGGLPIGALVLIFSSLPFLANGRIGELGASVLDDLSVHMARADALRAIGPDASVTAPGYPMGPHTTVAALAEGIGVDTSAAFTGLLLATPVLTSLTALAAFDRAAPRLRALGAGLTGIAYLPVSYIAQGAFKEPLLALCFLGFVLTLRDAGEAGLGPRRVMGLTLTAAAGVAAFGVTALAWPVAALAWLGVLAGLRPRRLRLRLTRARLVPALAAVVVLSGAGVTLAAQSDEFFRSGPGRHISERGAGGNFVGQLSPLEALGIWPAADFRFVPTGHALLVPGAILATAVVVYGLMWCRRRREWALLAAALGGVSVYVIARPTTLAYFSGKALAVVAPVLSLIGIRALLAAKPRRGGSTFGRAAIWSVVVAAFAGLAGYSSALALRGAHVRPQDRGPDVAAFQPITRGEPTVYLGRDNFVGWELRGTPLSGFQAADGALSRLLDARDEKLIGDSPAVDADSLDPNTLNRFRYLVTPRTAYASLPPANFRPIRRSRWHVLWERRGPTPERLILLEGEAPGAVLDCRRVSGRRLARSSGVALVRPPPVVGGTQAWRRPDGARPDTAGATVSGGAPVQELELGQGTWEISLRYFSEVPLSLSVGSIVRSVPAYVGDRSSFVGLGRITTQGGRLTVEVKAEDRPLGLVRTVELGSVAATRVDDRGRLVPLERACGAYVDWYRLGR